LIREDAHPNRIRIVELTRLSLVVATVQRLEENLMSFSASKIAPAALILAGAVGLSGCATKSFVREQIAPVSQRVDTLEARLQETDGTAKAALAEARAASGQLQSNGQRLDQLTGRVDGVEQRLQAQESRPKRPRH
jgi:outer membrane murein-binding lipoprotein Lpp